MIPVNEPALGEASGAQPPCVRERAQAGHVRAIWDDASRALELLGYAPIAEFAVGLERECLWLRDVVGERKITS